MDERTQTMEQSDSDCQAPQKRFDVQQVMRTLTEEALSRRVPDEMQEALG